MSGTGPAVGPPGGAGDRRRLAAVAGHTGDVATARRLLADPEPAVRATALGSLVRLGAIGPREVVEAAGDPAPAVRQRAAEVLADPALGPGEVLADLLGDVDPWVAEGAAWAVGERHGADPEAAEGGPAADPVPDATLARLIALAVGHDDLLVREAAVAALGALGDPAGLPAILAATGSKPALRRRAVVALAPFLDDPRALAALRTRAADRDWQVREAAEILLEGLDEET